MTRDDDLLRLAGWSVYSRLLLRSRSCFGFESISSFLLFIAAPPPAVPKSLNVTDALRWSISRHLEFAVKLAMKRKPVKIPTP